MRKPKDCRRIPSSAVQHIWQCGRCWVEATVQPEYYLDNGTPLCRACAQRMVLRDTYVQLPRQYYLLTVTGDVEPEVVGPFRSKKARDAAATKHRATDPSREDGLFPLDMVAGKPVVDMYSGGFFPGEDGDDDED